MKRRSKRLSDSCASFSHRERCIFSYWNGSRIVWADPLELHLNLLECPGVDLERDAKLAFVTAGEARVEAAGACRRLVAAVRRVFQVEEFQEEAGGRCGLTSAECLALLGQFAKFVDRLKKKAGASPTSAPTTAPASPAGGSAMPNTPASTSAAIEPCCAAPRPSPSACA